MRAHADEFMKRQPTMGQARAYAGFYDDYGASDALVDRVRKTVPQSFLSRCGELLRRFFPH